MVKNTFNKDQRRVIRKACKIQIDSLTNISRNKEYIQSQIRLSQIGIYAPSEIYEELIRDQIAMFTRVKKYPSKLYMIMGKEEIYLIKHILFNKFGVKEKGIWKKLFLSDYIMNCLDTKMGVDSYSPYDILSFNLNMN